MLDWMKAAKTVAEDPVMGFDPNAVTRSETVAINAPASGVIERWARCMAENVACNQFNAKGSTTSFLCSSSFSISR